jgi:hypothetical protein
VAKEPREPIAQMALPVAAPPLKWMSARWVGTNFPILRSGVERREINYRGGPPQVGLVIALTVSLAFLLVTLPATLLTTAAKIEPLSATVAGGVA